MKKNNAQKKHCLFKYWNHLVTSRIFLLWNLLFLFAIFGFVFSLINHFALIPINARKNVPWKEHLFFFFYFTIISSVFAIVVSFFVITNKLKTNNINLKRLKNLTATALTITMVFYWVILFPQNEIYGIRLASGLIVHGVVPVLSLIVFFYECFTLKFEKKSSYLKTVGFTFIFPSLYLIMGIIFYYGLGGETEDAIYLFFDFNHGNVVGIITNILSIAISFPSIAALFVFINNWSFSKWSKFNKQK